MSRVLLGALISAAALAGVGWFWNTRPEPGLPPGIQVGEVVITKSRRELALIKDGKVLKRYAVSLGSDPLGPKTCRGDGKTPEGRYRISVRNGRSRYHLALGISYPGPADRRRARETGCPPGGDIVIHGLPNGWGRIGKFHRFLDWTRGCIAVTDAEMEELFQAVPLGTPVVIRP